MRNADRRLIEGIAEHGFRLAQIVAGGDQVGDVGDRADPAGDAVGGDHLFGEMANAAVVGLGAVAVESASDAAAGRNPPRRLACARDRRDARARAHASGPCPGSQSEHAAIFGIAIDRRCRLRRCDRSRPVRFRAEPALVGGRRSGEQRKLRQPRLRFGASHRLLGEQQQAGALFGRERARACVP